MVSFLFFVMFRVLLRRLLRGVILILLLGFVRRRRFRLLVFRGRPLGCITLGTRLLASRLVPFPGLLERGRRDFKNVFRVGKLKKTRNLVR